jgi:hypothetical protein
MSRIRARYAGTTYGNLSARCQSRRLKAELTPRSKNAKIFWLLKRFDAPRDRKNLGRRCFIMLFGLEPPLQ